MHLDKKYLQLEAENTKAKKARTIPIIPILETYLKKLKRKCQYVVCYAGKRINSFSMTWKLLMNNLDWSYRIHDLRHHFITLLFSSGVNPRMIQKIAGHATLNMTMKYAEYSDKYLKKEAEEVGIKMGDIWATSKKDILP